MLSYKKEKSFVENKLNAQRISGNGAEKNKIKKLKYEQIP